MKSNAVRILAIAAALNLCAVKTYAAGSEEAPAAENVSPGEALFNRKCAQCHSLAEGKNGSGPTLYGIVDREAAVVPGFKYSRAMRDMAQDPGLEWNDANLAAFLARPSHLVPGTRMAFPGIADEKQLAALIDWLKANSGPPSGKK